MTSGSEVTYRPRSRGVLWPCVALGAAGAGLAVAGIARWGEVPHVWVYIGLSVAVVGIASLLAVTARVDADTYGLRFRTLLHRRSVPWRDIADFRVRLYHKNIGSARETRGVILVLRDGHKRLLPLPRSSSPDDQDFDARVEALRALHRRYGTPESGHLVVVSNRTAGRGWVGSLSLCALLLAGAGLSAWFAPAAASYQHEWRSATPCTAATPAAQRGECLTTIPARIARTEAHRPKKYSWLYFTDGRPLERLEVSYEAAQDFQAGDAVELTVWRHHVMKVAGAGHVWNRHVPAPGDMSVLAAVLALAAGCPGALVLLRLRGRRLPDDEVLPSALPFAGALAGTALWLLPLCYLHPTTLLSSHVAIGWEAAGSLVSLAFFVWAWRATRIRAPEAVTAAARPVKEEHEVLLAARFLEHTDYNPHGFGTHIVLGDGSPAVIPHSGPGRFAAKRIPVERLTVKNVRRARGSEGDIVPSSWHIAELDDAGEPVRLAAAPADLTRIIRELRPAPAQ
ncbi:PH domain-containing protein [Streptomyces sp. CA-106110]|uniref:PH domain-containing protein n=1 Tax=Streptomyces sp. CA-106110 TaxID=3240044 RepID=UPI003D91D2CF